MTPASSVSSGAISLGWEDGTGTARISRPVLARERRVIGALPIVSGLGIAAVLLVAMALDLPALVLLGSLLAAVTAVVAPAAGVATLAVMMPLREPDAFGPLGFGATIAAATVAGCLFRLPVERPRLALGPGVLLLGGYLLYSVVTLPPAVSGFSAEAATTAVYQFIQLASGVLVFAVGFIVFQRRDARPFLVAGLVGAAIAAVLGIVFLAAGGDDVPFRGLYSALPWVARAVGPFGNTNYYGEFLAFSLLLAVGSFGVASGPVRLLLVPIVVVLAVAFVLTFSRGAILTLGAGILVWAFARGPRTGLLVAAGLALLVVSTFPAFIDTRLDLTDPGLVDRSGSLNASDASRLAAFGAGFQLFASEPLFGIGFGQYQVASADHLIAASTTYPHNAAIRVLAEQGVFGLAMAAGILVLLARAVLRSTHPLRRAALATFAAYLVGAAVLEPFWSLQTSGLTWLLLAAVVAPPSPTVSAGRDAPVARLPRPSRGLA